MQKASLISIGAYAPAKILTNFDLEKMVDTSDEWIVKRTGIKERRIAAESESTSDMGVKAAQIALKRYANSVAINEIAPIDALICATVTPDHHCMPSTACKIAAELGLIGITAFDISAACSGFIYALQLARSLVESGAKRAVLVVGADKFSSILDWSDRGTCILFGDGAGAAVVAASDKNPIIDIHTASDGQKADLLITPAPGTACALTASALQNKMNCVKMVGNEVFKIAVQTLTKDVVDILNKNQIAPEKVDLFIPHQANLRIINAVKERLNFSDEKCVLTVAKYGNTSSASIPMAMNEAYEDGRLKNGSLMLLDAFGGGFTWGSALLYFGGSSEK